MEHRVGTRVKLDTASQLRGADGRVSEAVVRNASLTGAFLETGARLPVLSRVAVRSTARGDGGWLEACVVRMDATGMGLEWLDPGVHAVHALLCPPRAKPPAELSAPEASIQEEALARARSEVASGEFDVQG